LKLRNKSNRVGKKRVNQFNEKRGERERYRENSYKKSSAVGRNVSIPTEEKPKRGST